MPEDTQKLQDERDVLTLALELNKAKEQRDAALSKFQASDAEARRVPQLKAELERSRKENDKLKGGNQDILSKLGSAEKQIRELESKLRAQADLEAESAAAKAQAEAANSKAAESFDSLAFSEKIINSLNADIEHLQSEVTRLLPYEKFVKHLKQAQKFLGDL